MGAPRNPDRAPGSKGSTGDAFLNASARHVEIAPLGPVDGVAVSVAAANLQAVLGLPADVLPPADDPAYALIPARRQYNALPILEDLQQGVPEGTIRVGILNGDLCLPIFSYVLGEAQVGGSAAVISLFRLRKGEEGRSVSPERLYQRLAKVALHEAAHVLGLTHCREDGCLMRFSLGTEHIDALSMRFCAQCALRVVQAGTREP